MTDQRRRVPLLDKPPRGRFSPSGWGLLFALPFLVVGAWVAGIGAGVFPEQPGTAALPWWLVAGIGVLFFAVGFHLAVETLRGMAVRALAARVRDLAPWRFDRRWSRRVVHDETGWAAYKSLAGAGAFGVFVAVLHAPLVLEPDPKRLPVMLYVVLGVFDLIFLGLLLHGLTLVTRRLRYGRTRVRLEAFPFYVGATLDVVFEGGAALADRRGLRATLRCIEEGPGDDRPVCYQVWAEERVFDTDHEGRAALSFELPADLPGNRLLETPPTYWQLEARETRPGVDYAGTFLMPVYRGAPR